jgi:hypothetical protein
VSPFVDRPSSFGRSDRGAPVRHWLTLGALGSSVDALGVRGQIDVIGGGRWSLGIAGGWRGNGRDPWMHADRGVTSANLFVGTTHEIGHVTLRAQLGLGIEVRAAEDRMDRPPARTVVPAVDAGVFAVVPLGDRWGLVGGPVLDAPLADEGRIDISAFLGVRYGL